MLSEPGTPTVSASRVWRAPNLTYLAQMLAAPIQVITIGGVMSADPGCVWVQHLHYLYGADDAMDRVGKIAFAGRWPVMKQSPWNRMLGEEKITITPMGPMPTTGRWATSARSRSRMGDRGWRRRSASCARPSSPNRRNRLAAHGRC
jgi:hypothetical protein